VRVASARIISPIGWHAELIIRLSTPRPPQHLLHAHQLARDPVVQIDERRGGGAAAGVGGRNAVPLAGASGRLSSLLSSATLTNSPKSSLAAAHVVQMVHAFLTLDVQ
jgi:hypothetical protein